MKLIVCSLLLLVLVSFGSPRTNALPPTQIDHAVTKENWRQHPQIKAVRAVVQRAKDGISNKSFKLRKRKFAYCEPYEDTGRTLGVDGNGRVRYYERQAGSDDSALKWEHYYDEAGRLRFVFITGGAVNGSELEHRIYFDAEGKRIWEEQKYTKGPGYTFPEIWPDEQLQQRNVADAFNAKSPCQGSAGKKRKGGK